jgi:hypothetical protein
MTWIDQQFPQASGKHAITSKQDDRYNCIAWAVQDDTEWWSHLAGYKWPAPRSPRIDSLVALFTALGFKRCAFSELESGWDKVALYQKEGLWKHAARQLPSGKWTSKLGPDEDIEHDDPACICGDSYGELHCIMQRPVT